MGKGDGAGGGWGDGDVVRSGGFLVCETGSMGITQHEVDLCAKLVSRGIVAM